MDTRAHTAVNRSLGFVVRWPLARPTPTQTYLTEKVHVTVRPSDRAPPRLGLRARETAAVHG